MHGLELYERALVYLCTNPPVWPIQQNVRDFLHVFGIYNSDALYNTILFPLKKENQGKELHKISDMTCYHFIKTLSMWFYLGSWCSQIRDTGSKWLKKFLKK
jgi:hypothetical protein